MQNLKATTSEVVHLKTLWAVHYKPLQEVHSIRYSHFQYVKFIKFESNSQRYEYTFSLIIVVFSVPKLKI